MKLKIKKLHENTAIPTRAYAGDAGLDLIATSVDIEYREEISRSGLCSFNVPCKITVGFGVAVEIPKGFCGKLHARSSIHKTCCRLSNGVGLIDSGYRGELKAVFDVLPHLKHLPMPDWNKPCAQLVIEPYVDCELEEVDELAESERGAGGYGSSDKKGEQNA